MTTPIEPLTLDELTTDFNNTLEADAGKPLALTPGSILGAYRNAAVFSDLFVQAKAVEVGLDGRLDTCEGDSLDTFVEQFVPPFTARIAASKAYSAPLAPTTLASVATSTYLRLASVFGLVATQALRVTNGAYGGTTTITTIEPTTTLTTTVTNTATNLVVGSTAGMTAGGELELSHNGYTTRVSITSVGSGTEVTVTAVSPPVTYSFVGGATTVKLLKVVLTAAMTLDGGSTLANLVTGSLVRATSLIAGARFYRNTATASPVLVPNGSRIGTPILAIEYEVVADVSNPDYSIADSGYYIPANATAVYVKVQAVVAGATENVLAASLTSMSTAISGVDGVSNPYAIANGVDEEDDDTLKTRFHNFMTGRASGTEAALRAAIEGVSPGIQYNMVENVANDGTTFQPGNFIVVAGDDNGLLTNDMYTALFDAIDAAAPFTSTFLLKAPDVLAPVIIVVLSVLETADLSAATIIAAVETAIYNGFNATPAGSTLVFNTLIELAMAVDGVVDVVRCTVNGDGFDTSSNTYVIVGDGPTPLVAGAFEFIRPTLNDIQVS